MSKPTLLIPGNLVGGDPRAVPVEYIVDQVKKRMPEYGAPPPRTMRDRVFVIRSETGSGKSTALVVHLFRLLRGEKTSKRVKLSGPGLICTQPRVITAQTLAREMGDSPHYPDMELGVTVGYQTGSVNEKPRSGLVYATVGILLMQLRTMTDAEVMNMYRFIVVDEAHERSLQTDSTLMRLKAFLKRNMGNPRLPFVILASATIPVKKYAAYFEVDCGDPPNETIGAPKSSEEEEPPAKEAKASKRRCPNIIEVSGRTFAVTPHFPAVGTNNYVKSAADVAVKIHRDNPEDPETQGDILIFMPGREEIKNVVNLLQKYNREFLHKNAKLPPFLVLRIIGDDVKTQSRDYQRLTAPVSNFALPAADDSRKFFRPTRKIIVATVIAETGLTIETLKYVVDCGWARSTETYFPGEVRGLITRPAPLSRVEQRMGRAGRKAPGDFYPLYTRAVMSQLEKNQPSEIVTHGVEPIILDVVEAATQPHGFYVENIDMLDAPPNESLAEALETCVVNGYLRFEKADGIPPEGKKKTDPADGKKKLDNSIQNVDNDERSEKDGQINKKLVVGYKLTDLGRLAARFSTYVSTQQKQTIFAAYLWRVSVLDALFVAAAYDPQVVLYEKLDPEAFAAGLPEAFRASPVATPSTEIEGTQSSETRGPNTPSEKVRARVADDFIEMLVVFEGFSRAVEITSGKLEDLAQWCDLHKVVMAAAMQVALIREEIIDNVLLAGLNPFWGEQYRLSASKTHEEFFERVARLKQCIYAGLWHNLLVWDDARKKYLYPRTGRHVSGKYRGKKIVTTQVKISSEWGNPKIMYVLRPARVSTLDGYVNVDETLLLPRATAGD